MERYFELAKDDQRTLLQEAARRMNLPVQSIEKDLWVCWLLRKLMSLDPWGAHLTFKGGTSLSKAHGLIERFSEDIDLVVDREALELVGENDPKKADSPTQIKQRVKRIAKACHQWATEDLVPTLQQAIKNDLTDPDWHLDLAPITETQETSFSFRYPKLFDEGTGYLRPEIKVELVAKADPWPSKPMPISTYVHQQFPDAIGDGRFQVNTMQAERTMLEKALLLHEVLIQRPEGPKPRLARHYYDLFKLYKAGFGERATHDRSLYTAIIEHRRTFYRYGSVDYDELITEGFSIIPQGDARKEWEKDYANMQRDMFYGDVPAFDTVMEQLAQFEGDFRKHLQLQDQNNG